MKMDDLKYPCAVVDLQWVVFLCFCFFIKHKDVVFNEPVDYGVIGAVMYALKAASESRSDLVDVRLALLYQSSLSTIS